MAKRGRKPIPPAQKEDAGNPGRRPYNKDAHFLTKIPPAPVELRGDDFADHRKAFRKFGKLLIANRTLTQDDIPLLVGLALYWVQWWRANRDVALNGIIVDGKKNPNLTASHWAWREVRRILIEFGMTPSERGRPTVSAPTGDANPDSQLDKFINKGLKLRTGSEK